MQEYVRIAFWQDVSNNFSKFQRNWDYEPISLKSFTSDESLLKIKTKVDRLGRGEFAFSMTLDWNYDVDESTMVNSLHLALYPC